MDWKLELVPVPVTDVDRAKSFYVDQVGFHADHDHEVSRVSRRGATAPAGASEHRRPPLKPQFLLSSSKD